MLLRLALIVLMTSTAFAQAQTKTYKENDILGVWKLNAFYTETQNGNVDYCEGVSGSITYLPGYMSVGINCEAFSAGTNAEMLKGKLFYSGPMEVDSTTNEVIHRVRNYSHPSLHKVFRRKISMKDSNHLKLEGLLSSGEKVILTWTRTEKFKKSNSPVTGLYELVGSENEVSGIPDPIPFCNGFYGTIFFTPGMHTAVSINCGEKPEHDEFEPAEQFGRKYFYNGTYSVKGNVVTQLPENSSEVTHICAPAIRIMEMKGDILTLSGMNGSKFKAVWKKVRSL